MSEPQVNVVNRNYVWTALEERIFAGDIFAFSVKERIIKSTEPLDNGSVILNEQHIAQPQLTSAILVKIFDNERVQILDEDGVLAIIDRAYFKDFVKVYDKDSAMGISFYGMVMEKMMRDPKTLNEFALKYNIMCTLSKEFLKITKIEDKRGYTKKVVKNRAHANTFSK